MGLAVSRTAAARAAVKRDAPSTYALARESREMTAEEQRLIADAVAAGRVHRIEPRPLEAWLVPDEPLPNQRQRSGKAKMRPMKWGRASARASR